MRILSVWVFEFIKLLGRRRLHPLNAECPICHRVVRLHYNAELVFENVVFKHAPCSAVAVENRLGTCHTGASGSW
jgi:hypothetical protein